MATSPLDRDPPSQVGPLETFSAATRARSGDEAGPWLSGLTDLIAELRQRWRLELDEPGVETDARYVLQARRDGDRLILELSYPDGWWAETTRALEAWHGDGVLRLFDHDARGARSLEDHEPAAPPPDEPAALRDACAVARRLWIQAPDGITAVAAEVRVWASELQERHVRAGRPFEPELVRAATELFSTLGPTQGDRVLLHGDLRLASIALADDRRVALDPQPLVGEREFDAASLLRDTPGDLIVDMNDGRQRVKTRFEVLIDELGCNANRLKGWAFATGVDQAVWCAENGDHATAAAIIETARMIRALEL
jgi:streptomycin 6-kinase